MIVPGFNKAFEGRIDSR